MNIQDYISYYIGLRVKATPYGGQSNRWEYGTLVGMNTHSVCFIKFDNWQSVVDISTSCIKPLLRKLNSMREDEALHIAELLNFGMTASDGAKIHQVKQMLGSVYYFNKFYTISAAKYVELFHYLLRQGFDLFNLIDAGLAVDKNEIKA